MRTYKVTLTAAQGGRHPHVFRIGSDIAGDAYGAIIVAYHERSSVTVNRRDIHTRGADIGAYYVVGTAGAITYADVEIVDREAPAGPIHAHPLMPAEPVRHPGEVDEGPTRAHLDREAAAHHLADVVSKVLPVLGGRDDDRQLVWDAVAAFRESACR